MYIPSKYLVTVQDLIDGFLNECNHAGAKLTEVDDIEWDKEAHTYTPTGTVSVLMCDKSNCKKQFNGEWL